MKGVKPTITILRFHKPAGVLSATAPSKDGPSLLTCLSPESRRVVQSVQQPLIPIGRLDKFSSGLLLLTTMAHANLIAKLVRPGEEGSSITKVYQVTLSGSVPDAVLEQMRSGMEIVVRKSSVTTLPCIVERRRSGNQEKQDVLSITLRSVLRVGGSV